LLGPRHCDALFRHFRLADPFFPLPVFFFPSFSLNKEGIGPRKTQSGGPQLACPLPAQGLFLTNSHFLLSLFFWTFRLTCPSPKNPLVPPYFLTAPQPKLSPKRLQSFPGNFSLDKPFRKVFPVRFFFSNAMSTKIPTEFSTEFPLPLRNFHIEFPLRRPLLSFLPPTRSLDRFRRRRFVLSTLFLIYLSFPLFFSNSPRVFLKRRISTPF